MTLAAPESASSLSVSQPTAGQLQSLVNTGKHREAAALLDGVDLAAETAADFLYYAAVCLGSVGQDDIAIDLLKRAVAKGFLPFWCAFHLGLFEMHRRRPAAAASYLTGALILHPERHDIDRMLDEVAPGVDRELLRAAQSGTRSAIGAAAASSLAVPKSEAGNIGAAAHYLTIALFLDPTDRQARARLLQLTPDLATAVLPSSPAMVETGEAPKTQQSAAHADGKAPARPSESASDVPSDLLHDRDLGSGLSDQPAPAPDATEDKASIGRAAPTTQRLRELVDNAGSPRRPVCSMASSLMPSRILIFCIWLACLSARRGRSSVPSRC